MQTNVKQFFRNKNIVTKEFLCTSFKFTIKGKLNGFLNVC